MQRQLIYGITQGYFLATAGLRRSRRLTHFKKQCFYFTIGFEHSLTSLTDGPAAQKSASSLRCLFNNHLSEFLAVCFGGVHGKERC